MAKAFRRHSAGILQQTPQQQVCSCRREPGLFLQEGVCQCCELHTWEHGLVGMLLARAAAVLVPVLCRPIRARGLVQAQ